MQSPKSSQMITVLFLLHHVGYTENVRTTPIRSTQVLMPVPCSIPCCNVARHAPFSAYFSALKVICDSSLLYIQTASDTSSTRIHYSMPNEASECLPTLGSKQPRKALKDVTSPISIGMQDCHLKLTMLLLLQDVDSPLPTFCLCSHPTNNAFLIKLPIKLR